MRLENPAALALLAFVLLLLLTRRRSTRVRFPVANLYLWQEASSTDAATLARRLRRHWLLILQAAFLAAVVVAIARPGAVHQAPVALVLDTSLSMGARQNGATRFDVARGQALSLLEQVPGGTRVRIIAAGAQPHAIGTFEASAGAAVAAIDSLRITDAAADLSAAIDYARAADERPGRIYVVSDADASPIGSASSTDVEWSTVGEPVDNAAVTNLSTRLLDAPGDRRQVVVGIANHGAAVVNAELTLTHAETQVGRRSIFLPARSQSTYSFVAPNAEGVLTARLEHDDALSSDNVRSVVVSGGSTIRVALAHPQRRFLELALTAHPDVIVSEVDAGDADIVLCDPCSAPPDGRTNILFVPVRSPQSRNAIDLVTTAGDHPLAAGLELDGTSAVPIPGGGLPTGSTVVAQGAGIPAVVAYQAGARRVVELRVDPDAGSFPFSTAFPVLVSNIVHWLAGRDASPHTLTAGEPLQWRVGAQRTPPVVLGPAGRSLQSTFSNGVLALSDTSVAGLYRVQLDSGERAIAVNPAVDAESDLSVLSSPARTPEPEELPLVAAAYSDSSTTFVLGALLLLALEWRCRLRGARTG